MKKFFKFLFKGLISNQECLDGRKVYPWWSALIFLFVSVIISIVPTFVNIASSQGSAIVSKSGNGSLDTSLALFTKHLKDNNIEIKIDDNGIINTSVEINPTGADKYEYLVTAQEKELLAVRMVKPGSDETEEEAITKYRTMYASGATTVDGAAAVTPRSHMLISENYIYVIVYARTDSVVNTLDDDGKVKTYASTLSGFVGQNKCAKGTNITSFYDATAEKPVDTCTANWSKLFDNLYAEAKTTYLWSYSGIMFGLNFGVALIVSLLVMILTRLKSATGDKLNYFDAVQVVAYASLAPALLSVAFGFILSQMAQIGFILFLGLRATFMGTRAANPERYANQ